MEQKTYVIGGNTLTQSELSLNDGKEMIALLKDLDWKKAFDGSKSMYEIAIDYLDAKVLEKIFNLILKGDLPKGDIGDYMTASQSVEIIADFFGLNASLMKSVQRLMISLAQSSEASGDQKGK